jgi:hypothetical protein
MYKVFDNVPLSESSVSVKLVDIQQRCTELAGETGDLGGLCLEESLIDPEVNNPYQRA